MALSTSSGVSVRIGTETTFGAGPTSGNGVKLLVVSVDIQESRGKSSTNELDGSAIAAKSLRGLVSVAGTIVTKVRPIQQGFWEKLYMGNPVTTGTGPYNHTWTAAIGAIPSFALEIEYSAVTVFQQFFGMVVTGISRPILKDGELLCTISVMGQKALNPGTTIFTGGTVVDYTGEANQFEASNTSYILGTSTASFSAGNMDWTRETRIANKVDGTAFGFDVIRNKYRVDGQVTMWFENTDLLDAARSVTSESLAFKYDDGTNSVTATCPSTEWDLFSVSADANTDAQEPPVTFEATGAAFTVVIVNSVAGTVYTGF